MLAVVCVCLSQATATPDPLRCVTPSSASQCIFHPSRSPFLLPMSSGTRGYTQSLASILSLESHIRKGCP